MARKKISDAVLTRVLLNSRRRCCICFGLNRDLGLKSGQIAHLDQDSANSGEDNLAFLCFTHHDEFDSKPSQRKGLTKGEVIAFRAELYEKLDQALKMPVHFGDLTLPAADPYAGVWIRLGGGDFASAELTLTPIADNLEGMPRYAVSGAALWGKDREYGPNIGDIAFVGAVYDASIEHQEFLRDEKPHTITLRFEGDVLHVDEDEWFGLYGFNVNFIGEYRRA